MIAVCHDNGTENCGQNAACIKIKTSDKDDYYLYCGLKVKKTFKARSFVYSILHIS